MARKQRAVVAAEDSAASVPAAVDEFYRVPLTTGEALATLAALKTLSHLCENLGGDTGTVLDTGILQNAITRITDEMPDFASEQAERLAASLAAALVEAGLGQSGTGMNAGTGEESEPPFYTGRTRRLLEDAFSRRVPVEIEYYVRSRDQWTTRRVDIIDVYEEAGTSSESRDSYWNLRGHCQMRNDIRQFRLDHIRAVRVLDLNNEDDEDGIPDPFSDSVERRPAGGQKGDGATTDGTTGGDRRRRRRRRSATGSSSGGGSTD
jgi:hypothetical protein